MKNFLKNNYRQSMPQWLAEYNGNGIDLGGVRKTASVYYPGAGFDGQPIHTFNAGHAAYLTAHNSIALPIGIVCLIILILKMLALQPK